jgi:hypothetical protein
MLFTYYKNIATYITPYYSTNANNLFGSYPNTQIMRSTYTQSINGIDPLPLLYNAPNEDDFPNQFLNTLQNPLITRVCFTQCYNYKQIGLYIQQKYIATSASAVRLFNIFYLILFINQIYYLI